MTDAELLVECKKGLGISTASTTHDGVLAQKIQIVKAFMSGAGVSDTTGYVAIGAIVCGVTDLWNVSGGNIKFSPLFYDLVNQARIGEADGTV